MCSTQRPTNCTFCQDEIKATYFQNFASKLINSHSRSFDINLNVPISDYKAQVVEVTSNN